jgi:hypothetical protein
MDVALRPYKQHFEEYGCCFYTLRDSLPEKLTAEERYLISTVGLPDAGLPFFHFDLYLGELRDVQIEDSIMVIGSGVEPSSYNYLYVGNDHCVYVMMEDGEHFFINSSLRQLINSIYTYSQWLEALEDRFLFENCPEVTEQDFFNLYYTLREIDPASTQDLSVWHQLVNADVRFDDAI